MGVFGTGLGCLTTVVEIGWASGLCWARELTACGDGACRLSSDILKGKYKYALTDSLTVPAFEVVPTAFPFLSSVRLSAGR
jgi:hypothetical protein